MSRLSRAVGRCLMELVAPERRDWAEAVWAEAGEVPPGLARLAWRAGGVRLIAREAMLARRAARALVFAAAAAWVAHVAWPGPAGNPATAVNRLNVVTVVAVLAGLPLMARWRFGPAAPGRAARALRSGAYAAVLILTVAKASVEHVRDDPAAVPHLKPDDSVPVLTGMIYTWLIQSLFLLAVAGYVAAILALTARRPRVARATLAAGAGTGIGLGAVMYAVAPLGLSSPWLHGFAAGLVVLLGLVVVFGAPVVASGIAARRCREPGRPERAAAPRMKQAAAAGLLACMVGALMTTLLGTVTIALMPRTGWMLHWLYPGQHLSAAVVYHRALRASVGADGYGLMLLAFPVIGLAVGWAAGAPTERPGAPSGGSTMTV
jgi:hypothetical protein